MQLNPEETILLTQEEYNRIQEICNNLPEPTEHLLEVARQYKERLQNKTKTS